MKTELGWLRRLWWSDSTQEQMGRKTTLKNEEIRNFSPSLTPFSAAFLHNCNEMQMFVRDNPKNSDIYSKEHHIALSWQNQFMHSYTYCKDAGK